MNWSSLRAKLLFIVFGLVMRKLYRMLCTKQSKHVIEEVTHTTYLTSNCSLYFQRKTVFMG